MFVLYLYIQDNTNRRAGLYTRTGLNYEQALVTLIYYVDELQQNFAIANGGVVGYDNNHLSWIAGSRPIPGVQGI